MGMAFSLSQYRAEGEIERALVDRVAAAFQRLEKADHPESQVFEGAVRIRDVPAGTILLKQPHCRQTFAVLARYRAMEDKARAAVADDLAAFRDLLAEDDPDDPA